MKEEEIYEKALSVINEALDGNIVNPSAVSTANSMLMMLWSSIYSERIRREENKITVWKEEIGE